METAKGKQGICGADEGGHGGFAKLHAKKRVRRIVLTQRFAMLYTVGISGSW
jgi:hypothetical protein